jgi:hypothetical protein
VSGGSFDYLCYAEDPGLHERIGDMVAELDALDTPRSRLAAAMTAQVQQDARVRAGWAQYDPLAKLRAVWHAVEWWCSGDWSFDRVHRELARFDEAVPPPIDVVYENHRGEVAYRMVRPIGVRFGATEWHSEPQWLLEVWDVEKDAHRTFALDRCDFHPTGTTP